MVVFDANTLLLILSADVPAPLNPSTGQPVDRVQERITFLIEQLESSRTKIIIPAPVLSEILVRSGTAGPEYIRRIKGSSAFRVVPFDERAAVELAVMTREAIDDGDKRGGGEGTWAKVKFDRQIVAIAKVEGANVIYSDDRNVQTFAAGADISVVKLADLPLPPEDPQASFPLEEEPMPMDDANETDQDE